MSSVMSVAHGFRASLQATVEAVQHVGTYQLLTARLGPHTVRARLGLEHRLPDIGAAIGLGLFGPQACFYRNEELIT